MARLIILTGPSCVGKSPLLHALERLCPAHAQSLQKLILYNDRAPRPGEVDGVAYHFRPRATLEGLRDDPGFIVMPVRRDLQALDLAQVQQILAAGHNALFEGNVYIARALLQAPELAEIPKLSCLLSPLSRQELEYLKQQPGLDPRAITGEIMRRKLVHRTVTQKGQLNEQDLIDLEARCEAAWPELLYAPCFDWVLPNHDGEAAANWDVLGYPVGDALRSILAFAALLDGQQPPVLEKWSASLLQP